MLRIRTLAIALAGILLSISAAPAAEPPTLRSDVTVSDNIVRIGDLIDNAGIIADVPVFRAPALGQTGTIPASQVIDAVRAHALVGLDPGNVSEVTVTRASRAIAPAEIENLVAAALAKAHAAGSAADISVSFVRPLRALQLAVNQTGAPSIDQLRFDPRTGRFDATLTVAGASHVQLRLIGTAVVTAQTVELLRPLARGELIKLSDVTMRRVPRAQISGETVTNPDQAVGMAARTAINAGRQISVGELMKPELVHRGENVTIVYQTPGLMLAVRGKAKDGGTEGDMIDIVNLQSNRTVRATVIGRGQVAVEPMTARIIAAADLSPKLDQPNSGAK
jgi:flagella basal body P-ring formation protein FlgA